MTRPVDFDPPAGGEVVEFRDSPTSFGVMGLILGVLAFQASWWPSAGLFGICSLWLVSRAARRRVRLRITDEGITDETFGWYSPGLIPWEEVREIRYGAWRAVDIELKDEAAFLYRLSPLARLGRIPGRLFGLGSAYLNPLYFRASRRTLHDSLEAGLRAHELESIRRYKALEGVGDAE